MSEVTESTTNVIPLHPKNETASGDALREQVRSTIEILGITQKKVAREANLNGGTLNIWLHGKYAGNNAEIEGKLAVWLRSRPSRDAANQLKEPEWFSTLSAEKIIAALTMCQMLGNIVCIYGVPGVGKTVTLKHYKRENPAVWMATMAPSMSGTISALEEVAEAVGIRDSLNGARRLTRAIRKRIEATSGLLIIDEAQHLSVSALEELRAIHDATGVGLAIVGNEAVYGRLTGGARSSHFAQLFSRVGARLFLRRPTADDVESLAEAWKIDGAEEIEFLTQLSQRPGGLRGCSQALKFASVAREKGSSITVRHLRQAWSNLGASE